MHQFLKRFDGWPAITLGAIVLAAIAYLTFYSLHNLELDKQRLLTQLEASRNDNANMLQAIREKDGTISVFKGELSSITNTVDTLQKLTETDPELLKKYSKVYFLNENYVPASLTDIDEKYISSGAKNFYIYAKVWPYLRHLLEDANNAGTGLRVASAYRSFGTQAVLKSSYRVTYGSGANTFSADQGYSEHQLGTALDFTDTKLGPSFDSFAGEPAYQWLLNNAYRYGFILSYPKNNSFYKFEPWHWRFVGVDLATKLHEEGKYFYDLDQREIDSYLVKLFD